VLINHAVVGLYGDHLERAATVSLTSPLQITGQAVKPAIAIRLAAERPSLSSLSAAICESSIKNRIARPFLLLVKSNHAPTQDFEFLANLDLMILYQLDQTPRNEEWDAYLAALDVAARTRQVRCIVVTEGGYPNRAQRARMLSMTRNEPRRVAVISGAASVRFVVSAIALINPNIKAYSMKEYAAAFTHLQLSPAEGAVALTSIEQLARKLGLPKPVAA
jgi:hypothetical protein